MSRRVVDLGYPVDEEDTAELQQSAGDTERGSRAPCPAIGCKDPATPPRPLAAEWFDHAL
ncbi:hypothetical protein COL516b_005792 [Colletotrichum fioriniae]|nr:uncharacterized protein COL516b_005792 [Colletotrichum fioriniae]KAJ0304437.1 hypothetical protein COL516b_005792 [Colletotrichum fioriniae]